MFRRIKEIFVTDKDFYSRWLALAVPISLQSLITVGVNVMDTLMLSQLQEEQISASSLAGSYMMLLNVLSMGIGFGANVMASQYWGAKNKRGFSRTVALVLRIGIVVGVIVALFTALFPETIMSLYTSDEVVIGYGVKYLGYICVALLFIMLGQPLSYVIRSAGRAKVALYSTLGAFIINIFVNWVFIFGNLGMPRMEIAGAALGTMVSYIFQCVYVWIHVFVRDKELGCRILDIFRSLEGQGKVFIKYSLPVIISDFMLGIGMNMISVVMGHVGSYYVAANAVIQTLARLLSAFCSGLSNSSAVLIGHTLGEKDARRAFREGVTCTIVSALFGAVVALITLLVGKPYVNIYNLNDYTRETAYSLLYASAVISIFMMVSSTLTKGVLRGAGDTRYLMVIDIAFLWFISVPLGALAGLVFHWPSFWIYICLYSEKIIKTFVTLYRLKNRKWIHIIS